MDIAGISYRNLIGNYIFEFDLKAYKKSILRFGTRPKLDEKVEFERI